MKDKKGILIYVAGPLTCGDVNENLRIAMDMGTTLLNEGYDVIIPHLNMFLQRFWEENGYSEGVEWGYDEFMDWDYALLKRCDILYRIPGESPGSDMEVAFSKGQGKPIVHSLRELEAVATKLLLQRLKDR
jgi:hypothetical protein